MFVWNEVNSTFVRNEVNSMIFYDTIMAFQFFQLTLRGFVIVYSFRSYAIDQRADDYQ